MIARRLVFILLFTALICFAERAEGVQHPQDRQEADTTQRLENQFRDALLDKAIMAQMRVAAAEGHMVAQYLLGRRASLDHDDAAAAEWYRQSVAQGFGPAAEHLAYLYHLGRGVKQDDAEAAKWLLVAADRKAVTSLLQYRLALIYHFGIGLAPDEAAAKKWYTLALHQGLFDAPVAAELLAEKGAVAETYARTAEKYRGAEKNADAAGTNNLGFLYAFGIGVPEDEGEATRLFEKAAALGHTAAFYNAGKMAKWHGDREGAARWMQMASDKGHALARWELGVMYSKGIGLEVDQMAAVRWTKKAADAGVVGAQNNLGWHFKEGLAAGVDYRSALEWYGKAADAGYYMAWQNLGWLYYNGRGVPMDKKKAAGLYRKAAEWGSDTSQYNLALLYHYFHKEASLADDKQEALAWFRRAAEQMNTDAQVFTGTYYKNGWGTPANPAEAAKWFLLAAQQGHSMGQYDLGLLLMEGADGVPKNAPEACRWFLRAAYQENAEAQFNTGQCFYKGTNGKEPDHEKAANWMQASASHGYADAQFNVGSMYYSGDGLKKDNAESYFWFALARRFGNPGAAAALLEVGQTLDENQRKAAEERAKNWKPVEPVWDAEMGER